MSLIEEMKVYLNKHKLTQAGFARCLEVSPSTVCLWLSGKRAPNRENYIAFQKLKQEEKQNGNV